MPLAIPPFHLKAFQKIIGQNDNQHRAILDILKSSEPVLTYRLLAKNISQQAEIDHEDAQMIVHALVSMYGTRVSRHIAPNEFASELMDGVKGSVGDKFQPTPQNLSRFERFIKEFLSSKGGIEITSKAAGILLSNERNFIESTILTDVRPVFKEDPTELPAGAVVVHTLKIEYASESKRNEFFVALDSSDLKQMQETLERACLKESSLVAVLSKANLHVVKPDDQT